MKRLLKISLDQLLMSLLPILSWFMLSLIVDSNLINVFTLTYPIQFIASILISIFSTGANICKEKEHDKNAVLSGMTVGIILGALFFILLACNIETFLNYMKMDIEIYKEFTIFSVLQIYLQLIITFILNKLYYENKNKLANKYSLLFNILSFSALSITAITLKTPVNIIVVTLAIMAIFTFAILIKTYTKFKFQLNMIKNIKYDSMDLVNSMAFFLIYLFGISNIFEYGPQYATAISFVTLITDTQWDIFNSINTVAKIDISRGEFVYAVHLKNAFKLLILLLISIFTMFILLYSNYDLDFNLVLIYLGIEIYSFIVFPIYRVKMVYLQLEDSALKTTSSKLVSDTIRLSASFLKTPFCTVIGQVLSGLFQIIYTSYVFKKRFNKFKTYDKV